MANMRAIAFLMFSTMLFSSGLAGPKPIIKAKSRKYKALLSLDGGVFRGLIQTQILAAVEQAIKESIVERKLKPFNSTDQFNVRLSDYFDLVAGTSIGAYLSGYLVTNGADVAAKYPKQFTSLPGSAAGAAELFNILSDTVGSVKRNFTYANDAVGLSNAAIATLKNFFGNRSMHTYPSYNTAALFTWTRLADARMAYLFVDPKNMTGGYVLPADSSEDADEVRLGRDYYLWQAARGSGSYIPIIAPFNATTTPETPLADQTSMLIADGCFGAEEPAILAIPHMLNRMQVKMNKIAILSLGTTSFANQTTYQDLLRTIPVTFDLGWDLGGTANKFSSVAAHRALFAATKPGTPAPYLRIDRTFSRTEPCGLGTNATTCAAWKDAVLSSLPGVNNTNLVALKQIGQALAATNLAAIKAWVNMYLL